MSVVKKVFAAHYTDPKKYQHVLNIEVVNGNDDSDFIDEIVDLMNDDFIRDCYFKVE